MGIYDAMQVCSSYKSVEILTDLPSPLLCTALQNSWEQEWHFHTSIRVPAGTPVLQEPWQEVLRSNRGL